VRVRLSVIAATVCLFAVPVELHAVPVSVCNSYVMTKCRWPGSVTDGFGDDNDGVNQEESEAVNSFEPVRADNQDNGEGSTAAIDYRKTQLGSS